jgi:hypothetical protein
MTLFEIKFKVFYDTIQVYDSFSKLFRILHKNSVTGYFRVLSQTLASKISKLINFKGNYFLGFGFQDLMETYNTTIYDQMQT